MRREGSGLFFFLLVIAALALVAVTWPGPTGTRFVPWSLYFYRITLVALGVCLLAMLAMLLHPRRGAR